MALREEKETLRLEKAEVEAELVYMRKKLRRLERTKTQTSEEEKDSEPIHQQRDCQWSHQVRPILVLRLHFDHFL